MRNPIDLEEVLTRSYVELADGPPRIPRDYPTIAELMRTAKPLHEVIRVDAYISDGYVPDNDMKIDLYKRIRDAGSIEALDSFVEELEDRFGPVPAELRALVDVQALRVLGRRTGVARISVEDGKVEARFATGREPRPGALRDVLGGCEVPLEFDARGGLSVRFAAPRDRREALRLGRKVLMHFASCGSVT
jgi:transcription-repair coupling factor (superfamily II helicase)